MARADREPFNAGHPDRLIARRELRSRFPVSDMTIWRWMRAGHFPEPIRIGGRNYWRESQILQWLQAHTPTEASEPSDA